MFWSEVGGEKHSIMRAYMDGSSKTEFVSNARNAASKDSPTHCHWCQLFCVLALVVFLAFSGLLHWLMVSVSKTSKAESSFSNVKIDS